MNDIDITPAPLPGHFRLCDREWGHEVGQVAWAAQDFARWIAERSGGDKARMTAWADYLRAVAADVERRT